MAKKSDTTKIKAALDSCAAPVSQVQTESAEEEHDEQKKKKNHEPFYHLPLLD